VPDKAAALAQALREAAGEWPAPIDHRDVVESTNDLLWDAARAGAPEWSVVLADEQTAGRGRQGRPWASARGNLYLSVLLRRRFAPHWIGLVPLAAGVAVALAARECGAEAQIKWPNDVWVGGRKVAGILVEGHSSSRGFEEMIVGCGVNVAHEPATVVGDVAPVSLNSLVGASIDPVSVAARLLVHLKRLIEDLGADPDSVRTAWKQLALPWWGRLIEVGAGDAVVRGVLLDLAPGGGLVVQTGTGESVTIVSGEARMLRLA
jgi:BirA family transcriptional regulator, biotin operon repressor / biotin---[acetyl-CoA-carboxylase] ligase